MEIDGYVRRQGLFGWYTWGFQVLVMSLVLTVVAGLTIEPSEFSTTQDFNEIVSKISQQVDGLSRPFMNWDESLSFYQALASEYPYLVREVRNIGNTEEGNSIYAIHLSYRYTSQVDSLGLSNTTELMQDSAKPSAVIVGGHHANSMVANNYIMALLGKLVHGFHHNDGKITNLLKLRHIWVVPYLNIDGYKYIQSYAGSINDVQSVIK